MTRTRKPSGEPPATSTPQPFGPPLPPLSATIRLDGIMFYAVGSGTLRLVRSAIRLAVAWGIVGLLAEVGLPAIAAKETRSVLVLYSNSRLLPANIQVDHGLRQTIPTSMDRPVVQFDEFLDAPRFGGDEYERAVATYLREKYASRPPDVLVAVSDEALSFVLRNRKELFPQARIVHTAVPRLFLESRSALPADVVGVPIEYDFFRTIDEALRWHPQTRRLVLVTGWSEWDRRWEARLRDEVSRFKDRATAEFLAGLPTGVLVQRLV